MPGPTPGSRRAERERLLAQVEAAFGSLPERFLGAEEGFSATYHVRLGDVGQIWEVRADTNSVRVTKGCTRRPDVVLGTDASTWLALRAGELSGIEAFSQRRLYARGRLDRAFAFEGLFRLQSGRPPLLRIHEARAGRQRVSTLTMGEGPDVLLVHGLGATKASFLDTAAALSREFRVHAIDLPGFGSSSKPAFAPYDARWFASVLAETLDALDIDRAHLVGNSLGGRLAIEVGLLHPDRVRSLVLLCPAVAFIRRGYHPLVRLVRPEIALLPHRFREAAITSRFWSMFADPTSVDPSVADVVVDEFQQIYASAAARRAFLATARNIYLEQPFGRDGFYTRLAGLQPPAMFVWGTHDRLIPSALERYVRDALDGAEQIVLEACGHVPQVERPEQTNGLIRRHLLRADALGGRRALPRAA